MKAELATATKDLHEVIQAARADGQEAGDETREGMSMKIKVKDIVPNAWNTRGDENIQELAATMAAQGLLQAIVVRPMGGKYEIVAGERRWRAATLNGWKDIEATVREVDEREARGITLTENRARKKMSPFEDAREVAGMFGTGMTVEEIAAQIGCSETYVRRRLKLAEIDVESARKACEAFGVILENVPILELELLGSADWEKSKAAPGWAFRSVADMRDYLLAEELDVSKARWAKKDDFKDLPTCAMCLKHTRADGSLFPEMEGDGKGDFCLNPECWRQKAREHALRVAAAAKKNGREVVLLANDHDAEEAQADGVQRRFDYVEAKKGDKGAVQAVAYDGPEAGKLTWGRPIRAEKPDAKKPQEKADRVKWRKIGTKLALALLDADLTPQNDVHALLRSVMRFGVEAQGSAYEFPAGELTEMTVCKSLMPGVQNVLRNLGHSNGTEKGDRDCTLSCLEAFFPAWQALEIVNDMEAQVDGAKPSKAKKSAKKRA